MRCLEALAVITSVFVTPSFAAIIHDNFAPGDPFAPELGAYFFGETMFSPRTRYIGLPFIPPQNALLGTLTARLAVSSVQAGPPPDAIRVLVVTDDAGFPGSTVIDEFLVTGFSAGLYGELFTVNATYHAEVLAGIKYWLFPVLVNGGSITHRPYAYWPLNSTGDTGFVVGEATDGPGGPLFWNGGANGEFRLTGDLASVPEPGTLVLLAPAGVVLALGKRQASPRGSGKKS